MVREICRSRATLRNRNRFAIIRRTCIRVHPLGTDAPNLRTTSVGSAWARPTGKPKRLKGMNVMKFTKWNRLAALALTAPLAVIGCGEDDENGNGTNGNGNGEPTQNIVEIAQSEPSVSTLVSLLPQNIVTALSDADADVTVLAPTNAAFQDLGQDVLDFLADNPDVLEDVLQYHVLVGTLLAEDLAANTETRTTLLDGVTVESAPTDGGSVQFTDATGGVSSVVTADVEATNGVIHIIDRVLLPQEIMLPPAEDVVEVAQGVSEVSTLVSLLPNEIITALQDADGVTVLAPNNAAFDALGSDVLDFLGDNPDILAQILQYHVIPSELDAAALRADTQDRDTLLQDMMSPVTVQSAPDMGNGVEFTDQLGNTRSVVTADVEASNGIIHVIDGVLLPFEIELPPEDVNVVDTAQRITDAGTASFGTLLSVATAQGLAPTLSESDNVTLFAPVDAAFAAVGPLDSVDADVITNILLAHVVLGEDGTPAEDGLTAAELGAEGAFTSAANLTFDFGGTGISHPANAGASFSLDTNLLDVSASNGIIHGLADVIVPPTLLQVAVAVPDFSTLVDLVTNAASPEIGQALDPNTLAGDAPVTVFAPTNQAFEDTLGPAPELGQRRVDQVLSYHVVPGIVTSDELSDGDTLTTVEGSELTVVEDGGALFLETETQTGGERIAISSADIRTLTGVIHVVDGVLLPTTPNLVEAAQEANLNTLVTVAGNLGLAPTLTDPGADLTLFGPTDAALAAALPDQATITRLTNNGILENIVLFHVVPGTLLSGAVLAAPSLTSLANTDIVIDAQANPPTAQEVPLTEELDFVASNGVLHVLPGVMIPPTILEVAEVATNEVWSAVVNDAAQATEDAVDPDVLGGDDPITVFAPIDSAFPDDTSALPLDQILAYHALPGQELAAAIAVDGTVLTTLEGGDITVRVDGQGNVTLETETQTGSDAVPVIQTDIRTSNGVIHLIDGVLIPTPAD